MMGGPFASRASPGDDRPPQRPPVSSIWTRRAATTGRSPGRVAEPLLRPLRDRGHRRQALVPPAAAALVVVVEVGRRRLVARIRSSRLRHEGDVSHGGLSRPCRGHHEALVDVIGDLRAGLLLLRLEVRKSKSLDLLSSRLEATRRGRPAIQHPTCCLCIVGELEVL